MSKPKLLSPVASDEMLCAALRTGADAVYLGLGKFNARQNANDFGTLTLADIVRECHLRGVEVHLALNTLVFEEEMDAALADAKAAAAVGVDALIVQDLGLAYYLQKAAPDLPLHASTQCSCHTPSGVKALAALGFRQVVLARELSRDEIAACCGQGAEIETFAHGALCMSVSGQCYFSAMLGGRSGNRGLCAQTCRLPFADSKNLPRAVEGQHAALSLKDLALYPHLSELAALGVSCLKIEGRRKRPEYVAAATAVYRQLLDGETPTETLLEDLRSVFSRSGFTDSYYLGRQNALFGTRQKEDVLAAKGAEARLRSLYRTERARIPVTMALTVKEGAPTVLTLSDGTHTVTVTGETPAPSDRQMSRDRAIGALSKTGGTPYRVTAVTVDADETVSLSAAALNALRRQAVEALNAKRGALRPLSWTDPVRVEAAPLPPAKTERFVRVASADQVTDRVLAFADRVFLPWDTAPSVVAALSRQVVVGVDLPRALWGQEETVLAALKAAKAAGAAFGLCGNIGAIPLCLQANLVPVGGFGLNVTNAAATKALASLGVSAVTLSQEMTFRQMNAPWTLPVGAFVYGRQPLMLVRACPRRGEGSCKGCDGKTASLVDRKGVLFPLECHDRRFVEVLNSAPVCWSDKQAEIPTLSFYLFHFTTETAAEADAVVSAYEQGKPLGTAFTRGLYRRGVE